MDFKNYIIMAEEKTVMSFPKIKKVIYQNPVTVIIFDDGTKSIARISGNDVYDKQTGFLIAYTKRFSSHRYFNKMMKEFVWNAD